MVNSEFEKAIEFRNYQKMLLSEKKRLLSEICKDVKERRKSKIIIPNIEFYGAKEEFKKDIINNHEMIKKDSEIILGNRQIVRDNLDDIVNLIEMNRQRKLLNLMYSMNTCVLMPMFNSGTKIIVFDVNDIVSSLLVRMAEIKVNEDSNITKEAIDECILEKHNEILKLAKSIKSRNS